MSMTVKLSEVADLVMGQSPPSTSYNDVGEGLPFYQGKTDFGATHPTPRIYCREPKKIAEEGDILISVRAPVGATNLCQQQSCIGRGIAAIRVKEMDRDFLYFYLKKIEPYIDNLGSGAIFKAINKSQLADLPINEAGLSLPEQQKIAHILSTAQRAIEAQERIIQTTTELKKALMHKLFTEGLRNEPQKQTEIGPVPESWETPTVESVCTIKASAMSYKQLENVSSLPDGIRVIGIKVSDMNLPGNEVEFRSANLERRLPEEEALKRTVPENSIVFPKRGAAIATNKKRLTTGRTVLDPNLIAVMPTKTVSHRYLFHWFNTFDLKIITDPGPTPQLNKKDIAPLKFPLPPIEEQQAIAGAIDAVGEKVTLHARKRDQIHSLFRTLLHELMTAKKRVHNMEVSEQNLAAN